MCTSLSFFVFSVRMTEKIHKGIKKKFADSSFDSPENLVSEFHHIRNMFFRIAVDSGKLLRKLELARPV